MDFQGKFYSIKEITQETIINIDNYKVFRTIHNREKEKRQLKNETTTEQKQTQRYRVVVTTGDG